MIDAALGEILVTCSKLDYLIQWGEYYLKPESRSTNWILFYKSAKVYYEPLGVVAAIVSWNYRGHFVRWLLVRHITYHDIHSSAQRMVSHHGRTFCWQRRGSEMFRASDMVFKVVRRRYKRVFTRMWAG